MDYNKLKTFLVVAEEGSVSKAAKRLFVSQPAVTQSLQSLERELGVALLQRKNAKIFLTPEGKSISELANRSFSEVDALVGTIQGDSRLLSGNIKIGVVAHFGSHFVVDTLPGFKKQHPNVTFQLDYCADNPGIEEKLMRNEVDLGIIVTYRDKGCFEAWPLEDHPYQLVASRRLLSGVAPVKTLADVFARVPLIDFSPDFISFRAWLRINGKSRIAELGGMRPALVIQNQADARDLVVKGMGAAVLPDRLTGPEISRGTLVKVLPNSKVMPVGFDLAVRKKRTKKVIVELYLEYLRGHKTPQDAA